MVQDQYLVYIHRYHFYPHQNHPKYHLDVDLGLDLDLDVDLERWFARGLDNGMQMRVFMQTLDVEKAKRRKLPRIGGCFEAAPKVFL